MAETWKRCRGGSPLVGTRWLEDTWEERAILELGNPQLDIASLGRQQLGSDLVANPTSPVYSLTHDPAYLLLRLHWASARSIGDSPPQSPHSHLQSRRHTEAIPTPTLDASFALHARQSPAVGCQNRINVLRRVRGTDEADVGG